MSNNNKIEGHHNVIKIYDLDGLQNHATKYNDSNDKQQQIFDGMRKKFAKSAKKYIKNKELLEQRLTEDCAFASDYKFSQIEIEKNNKKNKQIQIDVIQLYENL